MQKDFHVGYIQGTNVIRIQTKEDLKEVWAEFNCKTMLWCDGLKEKSAGHPQMQRDNENNLPSKRRKRHASHREGEMQQIVENLKHSGTFTPM